MNCATRRSAKRRGAHGGPCTKATWPPCDEISRQVGIVRGGEAGQRFRRHEGIVIGGDDEQRPAHARQELARAGARPIVLRAGEAMQRRGHVLVEVGEGLRRVRVPQLVERRVQRRLGAQLGAQAAQEAGAIDARHHARPVERARAHGEIERHRHHGGGADARIDGVAALAEILGHDVAAQREAGQAELARAVLAEQLLDGKREIAGVARVIEARQAVGLARAATKVQGHAADAALGELAHQAAHVAGARAALEAVADEHDGRFGRGRREAIDVEEVAVGQLPALACGRQAHRQTHQAAVHGLRVTILQPGRRFIPALAHARAVQSTPDMRARASCSACVPLRPRPIACTD
jgi:hypothetical protein